MENDWLDTPYSLEGKTIWVAGHRGMVGSAVRRRLDQEKVKIIAESSEFLDLRDQGMTREWVLEHKPDVVVMAAARVGGILANDTYPADFLYDNLMMTTNVIQAAHEAGVERLLYLGSSCIYPKDAAQPLKEDALLSGALEPTNESYALAKIAGLKMVEAYRRQYGRSYISAMPCNLYGPGDRYDALGSHVIPALMMKAHDSKMQHKQGLEVWGSGHALREFLYVDDLADALVFLLKHYDGQRHINVGSGQEISISELAQKIAETVQFNGDLTFDSSKPDGVMRKVMDGSRMFDAGWRPKVSLEDGLKRAYQDFCQRVANDGIAA